MALTLDATKWRKKRGVKRLLPALGAEEGLTRYVGGAVRDELLGLPVNDVDLATRIPPDEVIRRLEKAKIKAVPTGIDHGTVTAVNVWDSPEAVADFFIERVQPTLATLGEPGSKPVRHGKPVAFYVRPPTG